MTTSVYIASLEGESGKSTVALGLLDRLTRKVGRVGVYRPVTRSAQETDNVVELLLGHRAITQEYDEAIGVSYQDLHTDPVVAMEEIIRRYHLLVGRFDVVVVLGSDYTDVSSPNELAFNASIAANLGSPVVLVVHGRSRTPAEILIAVEQARAELAHSHARLVAVVANRVAAEDLDRVRELLAASVGLPSGAIPETPLLVAPTVEALRAACGGTLVRGHADLLARESLGFIVAAMSLPNVLTRLHESVTVIAPGDRSDLLPGLVMAHESANFPALAAIVLTGGYSPPEPVQQLISGSDNDLPIIVSDHGTFETATALAAVRGRLTVHSVAKVETALRVFTDNVDADAILQAIDVADSSGSDLVTPLMFQFRLLDRARADQKHIVLPESGDERILRASASLLRLGVARLTLLGEERAVRARASALGLDISAAAVVSPFDEELVERFAQEYTRLRGHRGMTMDRAREVVTDVSYFGTMMVHLGLADGMVSGAAHTTAHTIKPSFEIIKTSPGTSIVSSVFLMCLADRVLVYGDCAVNPDPTAEQLADIAISSATTAEQFGVDTRVAMLSYSTGTSGTGADVDKVRTATELVRSRRPDLLVEGPIQYDAAVDMGVAKSKLPDSQVAGHATVLIFPDLNTGNNTYKAVQRSANAVAIGPVLQGLNRPVNDLSRGALVADIVNTVAITAIQAQGVGQVASGNQGES
ncbi:phosphate acetyltransferase [Nakamurella silvestris]|nr:phosphate acetyltransferase [Nakamurella silvestris]